MTESSDRDLGSRIQSAFGDPPQSNFDSWIEVHKDALSYLDPKVMKAYSSRKRFLRRAVSYSAVAAVLLVALFIIFTPQENAFAQTIETIKQAKTISWTIDWYNREYSVDGKRSWLKRTPRWERSFQVPSRYRDVRYADDGTITSVTIEDTMAKEILRLDMQKRTAMLTKESSGQFSGGHPFDNIIDILEKESVQYVGKKNMDGVETNVFRNHRKYSHGFEQSTEIWLDTKSKQIVRTCTTRGNTFFDPQTDADRDKPAEPQVSEGTIAGVIEKNINFDAQLSPTLFSLTPPEDFVIVEAPQKIKVTEEKMIQWLQLSAEANGGEFLELERGFNMAWHNTIGGKSEGEHTESEKKYLEAYRTNMLEGNFIPVQDFVNAFVEAGSFRYLGKGVRLGDKEKIVCFYKLRDTGIYRAVYGDLRVAEIKTDDLPL
jgi:outer membrane lipoprotein-sorting protein